MTYTAIGGRVDAIYVRPCSHSYKGSFKYLAAVTRDREDCRDSGLSSSSFTGGERTLGNEDEGEERDDLGSEQCDLKNSHLISPFAGGISGVAKWEDAISEDASN